MISTNNKAPAATKQGSKDKESIIQHQQQQQRANLNSHSSEENSKLLLTMTTVESASLINEKETVGVKRPSLPPKASRKPSAASSGNRNGVVTHGEKSGHHVAMHAAAAVAAAAAANNNDGTTRGGGHSTSYNPHMIDSLSTLSDKNNKIVVRIVTVFSVIFFLICFAMIAFTLRMSEKIDAQLRNEFSASAAEATMGSDLAASPATKQFHPGMLGSQSTTRMKRANFTDNSNFIAPKLI